jgi:hypothetical protein
MRAESWRAPYRVESCLTRGSPREDRREEIRSRRVPVVAERPTVRKTLTVATQNNALARLTSHSVDFPAFLFAAACGSMMGSFRFERFLPLHRIGRGIDILFNRR